MYQTCVAITRVNWAKNEGLVSIKVVGDSSTNLALTASFSSCRKEHTHFALDCPRHSSSTDKYRILSAHQEKKAEVLIEIRNIHMKLFPRSETSTFEPSTTVILPMPPSTRFFRASDPVGPQLSKHMLAFSNAACPWSPQILHFVGRLTIWKRYIWKKSIWFSWKNNANQISEELSRQAKSYRKWCAMQWKIDQLLPCWGTEMIWQASDNKGL